jgi:hypothetical protein
VSTSDQSSPQPGADKRDLEISNLREAYQEQGRRFTLLAELSRRLVSTLDPGTVLQEVVEAACELTGARYGALGVLDETRTRLAQFLTVGIDETRNSTVRAGVAIVSRPSCAARRLK